MANLLSARHMHNIFANLEQVASINQKFLLTLLEIDITQIEKIAEHIFNNVSSPSRVCVLLTVVGGSIHVLYSLLQ